jgi:hypothetical protein
MEAYLALVVIPLKSDESCLGELSKATVARPKPKSAADAVSTNTERPVHIEACSGLTLVVTFPVEGFLRGALAENVRRQPLTRRRVPILADMSWLDAMCYASTHSSSMLAADVAPDVTFKQTITEISGVSL